CLREEKPVGSEDEPGEDFIRLAVVSVCGALCSSALDGDRPAQDDTLLATSDLAAQFPPSVVRGDRPQGNPPLCCLNESQELVSEAVIPKQAVGFHHCSWFGYGLF